MQTLISMELTKEEAQEDAGVKPELPKYPWGLCIDLDGDALAKLGIDALPAVGSSVSIVAMAEVQSVSESQYQGDKETNRRMSLQITEMAVTPAAADIASALYDNGKS